MIVRRAVPTDLEGIVSLGHEMWAEAETSFPPVQSDRCAKQLELSIQVPNNVFIAVVEDDDGIVGVINGTIGDYAFSSQLRAAQDILFVTKEKRGSRAAILLLKIFIEWAQENGAQYIFAGASTGVKTDLTEKLFTKFGFTMFCRSFRRHA